MQTITLSAERIAWSTYADYMYGAINGHDLSRSDRAAMFWKAREYKRRAIRISMRLNERPS